MQISHNAVTTDQLGQHSAWHVEILNEKKSFDQATKLKFFGLRPMFPQKKSVLYHKRSAKKKKIDETPCFSCTGKVVTIDRL